MIGCGGCGLDKVFVKIRWLCELVVMVGCSSGYGMSHHHVGVMMGCNVGDWMWWLWIR